MKIQVLHKKILLLAGFFVLIGGMPYQLAATHAGPPTPTQDRPLHEVLEELGETYQVFFSYEPKLVKNIDVDFDLRPEESLDEAINRLLVKTNFTFDLISDKYIVVYKNDKKGQQKAKKIRRKIEQIRKLENEGGLSVRRNSKDPMLRTTRILSSVEESQAKATITGTVKGEDGEPLIGATVMVKGTGTGTITDLDGNFSLDVSEGEDVLVISYTGYQAQEVNIGGRTTLDIVLSSSISQLDEVVVIGYGARQAGELTGSVTSLNAEDMEEMVAVNTTDALKGSVSGVTIIDSHTPGGGANIRIRGLGTINNNDPLWIVDGVPNASVNPENIETLSILKDASAQAIYGARAANGVIIVTTKSGKKNQPLQVNFDVRRGVMQNTNSFDLLNTQEYGEVLWLEAANENGGTLPEGFSHEQFGSGAQPSIPNYISPAGASQANLDAYDPVNNIIMASNPQGTDWLDEADQAGTYQDISLGINGGSEKTTYAFQAGYLQEEGILKYTSFERYNLRANITTNPTDWLEIGERIGITYSQDNGDQSNNGEGSIMGWIYRIQPIIPVRDVAGNYAGSRAPRLGNGSNPVWLLDNNQNDRTQRMRFNGNFYAKADLVRGLSFKSLFGVNHNTAQGRNLTFIEQANAQRATINSYSESNNMTIQWNWSNTLEYRKIFGDIHDLTVLLGTEAIENNFRQNSAGRQGYFLTTPDFFQLDAGTTNQVNGGNSSSWALFSMFGRLNYQLADKYLLEAVVRRDASSRFGADNNVGVFPAVSVGWRISEESFMDFSENWLNLLKVRAGYGVSGNDQIGNYNSYTTFVSVISEAPWDRTAPSGSSSYYPIDGGNETDGAVGFKRNTLGNTAVEWERTTTTNFGVNMTIFDRIDIMVDLWQRNTENMLFQQQIPAVVGRAIVPSINVGEMLNRGFDVEVAYSGTGLQNELKYSLGLNVSRYKNELVSLSGNENEFLQGGTVRGQNFTRAEQGSQYPAFYGYTIDGIFQSAQEADAHPAVTEDPAYNQEGVFKIQDTNGDGQIDADDRSFIGSPHPDFTAGFSVNLSYKGFKFYTNFYASVGNDVVNAVRGLVDFNKFQGNRSARRLYESYGSPYLSDNANATMPMARINDERDQRPSTYFIEDGSYLRMQNLRLSYDLNRLFPGNGTFRSLTLYFHTNNLFTATGYSGLDPEIGSSGLNTGVDKGGWPTARRYLFGISLGL